jgi:hypothetical protein
MYCRESAPACAALADLQELLIRDDECNKRAARKVIFVPSQRGWDGGVAEQRGRPGLVGRLSLG